MKAWPHPPKTVAATVLLVLISVSGCSSGPSWPPDRATPAVKAEEARLAVLIGADTSIHGEPAACTVRLFGQQAGASFVWALCVATGPTGAAASLPLRVDGSKITKPGDGSMYAVSVRQMFPAGLAEFFIKNTGTSAVLPSAAPPGFPGG